MTSTLFERLLRGGGTRALMHSLDDLRARLAALDAEVGLGTFDRAVLAGAMADRLGCAFAAGYQSALRALVPGVARGGRFAALCATEEHGAHPRHIATRLEHGRLTGEKRWSTLASSVDVLLVVASIGKGDDGKNRLRLVRVDPNADGVTIERMPETSFMPEIPHAFVRLREVSASRSDVLPGDGYDAYVKPFRTVEDVHVLGAACGYLVSVARARGWPREITEDLCAAIAVLGAIDAMPPAGAGTHVVLAGAIHATRDAIDEADWCWASASDEEAGRWQRDRTALEVAARARRERAEAAWRRLSSAR